MIVYDEKVYYAMLPVISLVYRWYGTKATSRYGGL